MKLRVLPIVSALACAVVCTCTQAEIYHGRVDRVIDGDTIKVITNDAVIQVRIRGIDAPESDQPFGGEARSALNKLISGQNVILNTDGKDSHGRVLASVAVGGNDVGLYMIERGYAWYYQDYGFQIPADWQQAYRTAESTARLNGDGLWQASGTVPPWSWRKQRREANQIAEEEYRETLEGVTEELETNFNLLSERWNSWRNRFLSGTDEGDDPEQHTADQSLPESERLSWWEIFIKLGEGASRWVKAFITSFF
ncbi:MAG: thermonuclease family protein [Sutterellaceae bacterium]|nr:thermonuclease family protein [Sutterellaceae bacterium]